MYEAKVIADSICNGHRLTTMQLCHPRIVHAEFNTHCMFARNASSSRAIPFKTMVQRVLDDPYIPRTFGQNQKGMQPGVALSGTKYDYAKKLWLAARDTAVSVARKLASDVCSECHGRGIYAGPGFTNVTCDACGGDGLGLNVHKETVNRLLEPWGWITVAVTGVWPAWSNYFALRCHDMAAEALRDQAYPAQLAYFRSAPKILRRGMWHTPYVDSREALELMELRANSLNVADFPKVVSVSTGRCARTSYLTQEGIRDIAEDIALHDRLATARPMHASAFEHVAMATSDNSRYGKYTGWKAYRHMLPGEYTTDFVPNHTDLVLPPNC